jgi:Raf kinase inhibitor-like YbhB/YbcL family protein
MAFEISSQLFKNGENIPPKYAADAWNVSPALMWTDVPDKTKSLALLLHDPDAQRKGGFSHWVIFNIPPSPNYLPEGVRPRDHVEGGIVQGRNDADTVGYMGPAPPPGKPHHYHFTIYALDARLMLDSSADRRKLLDAMEGHVLAEAELVGIYQR